MAWMLSEVQKPSARPRNSLAYLTLRYGRMRCQSGKVPLQGHPSFLKKGVGHALTLNSILLGTGRDEVTSVPSGSKWKIGLEET